MQILSFQSLKCKCNQFRQLTRFGTLQVMNIFILLPSMASQKKWRKEQLIIGINTLIDHWIFSVWLDIQILTPMKGTGRIYHNILSFRWVQLLGPMSLIIILIPHYFLLPGSCPQPAFLQCHIAKQVDLWLGSFQESPSWQGQNFTLTEGGSVVWPNIDTSFLVLIV